jgi:hypothetical protein
MKIKAPPLILEKISDETNLHFLSFIEYKRREYVGIIDNITQHHVKAYIFENIRPNSIKLNDFMSTAIKWYYSESYKKPLSISISQQGLSNLTSPLYKQFDINGISRIVGQPFIFDHFTTQSVKKKKVLQIPEGIEIRLKKVAF